MSAIKVQGNAPLPLRKTIDPQNQEQKAAFEKKMRNAAELYERQFLHQMVGEMRKTIHYSQEPTMAQKIYMDKLYDKYVDQWTSKGGVGFADIIYDQLVEKYSPYHKKNIAPSHGPLPTEDKARDFKPIQSPEVERYKPIDKQENGVRETGGHFQLKPGEKDISSPWSGQVSKLTKDLQGRTWMKIKHDNGLESSLTFIGNAQGDLRVGESVLSGEKLGKLSADQDIFTWTVNVDRKSEFA